jgi:hypothetical protein
MSKTTFLIAIVFMTMVFSSLAYAYPNNTAVCFDANMSQVFNNSVSVANNTCKMGCNTLSGLCNTYDPISSTLIGIAFLIISLFFVFIATKASSGFTFRGMKIELLQPLFFALSFLMILAAFSVMIVGAVNSSMNAIYNILNSGYNTTMYVFIFLVAFMVISFIVNVFNQAGKKA